MGDEDHSSKAPEKWCDEESWLEGPEPDCSLGFSIRDILRCVERNSFG